MQRADDLHKDPELQRLERRVAKEAELAKRALQEYREALRVESVRASVKRRVHSAVARYMEALKDLNRLRSSTQSQ
jgi:hypothetical protein